MSADAKEAFRVAVKNRYALRAVAPIDRCPEITLDNAGRVLEQLWHIIDDDRIGLGAIGIPRGALRPLTFTVCSAPDFATAVRRYQDFYAAIPGLPAVAVEESKGTARLSFDLAPCDTTSLILASTGLLLVAHRVINWATRRPLILYRVELPHAVPIGHPDYQIMFGAPPSFDAPRAALVFHTDVLNRAFVRSHDDIETFIEDAPANVFGPCDSHRSVSAQVRGIIEDSLGISSCTSDEIAAGIAMSRPTLWRRLREENTTISQIRDQVLREAALESLARGDETVAQLSLRLGFSEPSAFSRAFRRWTGRSPRNYHAG